MKIAILGSGIIGLSTAVLARTLGWEVDIYAKQHLSDFGAATDPKFTSPYSAASIIPHSVGGENVNGLYEISNSFFRQLSKTPDSGIRQQKHMYLWHEGFTKSIPYKSLLPNFEYVDSDRHSFVPDSVDDKPLQGAAFDICFADMPIYSKWLSNQLIKMGCAQKRLTLKDPSDLNTIEADVILNALGAGAMTVFPHLGPSHYIKGCLLRYACTELWVEKTTQKPVSYNYYPNTPSDPTDIYAYPRHDSIFFGGLREVGIPDADGNIVWEDKGDIECMELEGGVEEFPTALLEKNRQLIYKMTGNEMLENPEVLFAYRFLAGPPENPRYIIKEDTTFGETPSQLFHCFGFGGAGITLSWGAAATAIDLIRQEQTASTTWNEKFSQLLGNVGSA